jgi:prevent-host-death family protein
MESIMETIAVSELRSKLMKVMNEVQSGSSVSITSRGKVVARLVPPEAAMNSAKEKLRVLGKTAVLHDVLSPIGEAWKAE